MSEAGLRSVVPGRVRLRVRGRHRAGPELQGLSEVLARTSGVLSVTANPRTGSLLLHYERGAVDLDGLRAAIEEQGIVFRAPDETARGLAVDPAARVHAAADGVDRRLREATDGLGLRFLVPVGMGALAGRRALQHGPRLRDAPWYVLAWYAFNTFTKLNHAPPAPGRRDHG